MNRQGPVLQVGLPRALTFYRHGPFLKAFLEGCGCSVLASPPTNLKILAMGTDICVDDVCVAVKVLFGHVRFLQEKVDAVLVPRMVSVENRKYDTFTCPKLIAAPDMIRFSFPRFPALLEFTVDVRKAPWWFGCLRLGRQLGAPLRLIARACGRAVREQAKFDGLLRQGILPGDALAGMDDGGSAALPAYLTRGDVAVALVGHPYLLGDALVNKRLVHWLEVSGARVLGSCMLGPEEAERELDRLPPLSWTYEKELLAAASHFLNRPDVDGVIYATSFGCGPDSLVMEIVRRELGLPAGSALLELVLDEHSAESGVRTRVEAFVDMLRYRKSRSAGARSVS